MASLHAALTALHVNYGVPHVVLSSIPLPISLVAELGLPPPPVSYTRFVPDPKPPWYDAVGVGEPEDDILVCFASTWDGDKPQTYGFALPTIRGYFSGVGDLFSALVLGHYQRTGKTQPGLSPLADAVSHALLTVQQILLRTHLYSLDIASSGSATPRPIHENSPHQDSVIPSDTELDNAPPLNPTDPKRKARRMRLREMRVVQERDLIVNGGETWPGKHLDWEKLRGD